MTGPVGPVTPTAPAQATSAMCPSFVGARVARLTRLNSCLAPMYGPENRVTTIGMVTVTMEPEVEEGESLDTRNLNGELCVSASTPDTMSGINISVEFCQVDPVVFSIMNPTWKVVRNTRSNTGGRITGWRIGQSMSDEFAFALELWPKVMGAAGSVCDEQQDEVDPNDPHEVNGYFLLPAVFGRAPDEWEITGDEVATFTLNGRTRGGSAWGYGPYLVTRDESGSPSPLLRPIEDGSGKAGFLLPNGQINRDPDHFHAELVTVSPPPAICGPQPLIRPKIEFVTDDGQDSGTVTIRLTNADEIAPLNPITGERPAVWVSWGDGSGRENITAPELEGSFELSHTYPDGASGEFMIRAEAPNHGPFAELIGTPGATIQITAPNDTFEMFEGSTMQLSAVISYDDPDRPDRDITLVSEWASSDRTVATVNNFAPKGVVTGRKSGTADITVTYGGKSSSQTVTVRRPAPTALTVDSPNGQTELPIDSGRQLELRATATYEIGEQQNVTSKATWRQESVTEGAKADSVAGGVVTATSSGGAVAGTIKVIAEYTDQGKTVTGEMQVEITEAALQEGEDEAPKKRGRK